MRKTFIAIALSMLCADLLGCGDDDGGAGDAGDTDTDTDVDTDTDADGGEPHVLTWIPITACFDNESPLHAVDVAAFEITETEVTQLQYHDVMGVSPSDYYCPECAVTKVSWDMAEAFCEAVGARLPTEAEWEYAARAGTTGPYYCGDESCLPDIAWYADTSSGKGEVVAQKDPNDFGLYDMLGNAIEWVEDCYHNSYTGAPDDGSAWTAAGCEYFVMRGGCYGSTPGALRVSWRDGFITNFYGSCLPGIRCARTPGGDPDAGVDGGK
jgi:formylglycine-generating enzyme required for sulfatase activity